MQLLCSSIHDGFSHFLAFIIQSILLHNSFPNLEYQNTRCYEFVSRGSKLLYDKLRPVREYLGVKKEGVKLMELESEDCIAVIRWHLASSNLDENFEICNLDDNFAV